MVIDFAELEVENGFGRFVDHTTKPPFSEDISRLALTIKNLSNVLGRPERTTMTAQALVGVDGALDMRGDLSGIGESLRADLVAELRDFSLASANPYADSLTSWIVQRGTLEAKIHYHVEGDRITADHELEFKKLRVEKSAAADAATRKIGVPLGLAVALLKDSNGDIDFNLPLSGNLADRQFDWGEMIWAGVKQVIAKVLLSPFRAVGRLFKGSDDTVDKLEVDPITFAPGSAVIAPSTEAQLTRLADFLGRSPKIKLVLSSVLGTADVERLKEGEVRARLEALRREQQLPDLAAAVRAYYQQRVPGVALPKTTDEQIALLVAREPAPPAPLAELAHRRIDVTREDLVKVRGLAESRVVAPPPSASRPEAPPVSGEGRVEFTMAPAEE
jgi:outer membrane protein OmpA-like peptidoglycan-associated protein